MEPAGTHTQYSLLSSLSLCHALNSQSSTCVVVRRKHFGKANSQTAHTGNAYHGGSRAASDSKQGRQQTQKSTHSKHSNGMHGGMHLCSAVRRVNPHSPTRNPPPPIPPSCSEMPQRMLEKYPVNRYESANRTPAPLTVILPAYPRAAQWQKDRHKHDHLNVSFHMMRQAWHQC